MDYIYWLIDFILHIDKHLVSITNDYGVYTYIIMFAIIFAETGLVFMPFLPGDSLLFALGSLTALDNSNLDITILMIILTIAAILGDTVNYFFGKVFGETLISKNNRFIKREYYDKTKTFYEKHGAKAIILARFVPIIRTFAPFVAGVGTMNYKKFLSFNIIGGVIWINIFLILGRIFSDNPVVKKNFTAVIFVIIIISILPIIIEFINHKRKKNKS